MLSLSIIIPTHNRAEILSRTLACMQNLTVPSKLQVELVVVANNCSDDTVAISKEVIESLSFPGKVVEEFIPGLSAARNRGAQEATGEICVMIDDDVKFPSGWISEIGDFFEQSPADIAGGRVVLWWDAVERPSWFTPVLDNLLSVSDLGDHAVELHGYNGIVGANFWFRKKVWETIGGFDSGLGRNGKSAVGGEESDFIKRALEANFRVFYTPDGALDHWVAPGRIKEEYLLRVATGNARGRVRMKPKMNLYTWIRCLLGHTYLFTANQLKAWITRVGYGRNASITYAVLSSAGVGGLLGLYDRFKH